MSQNVSLICILVIILIIRKYFAHVSTLSVCLWRRTRRRGGNEEEEGEEEYMEMENPPRVELEFPTLTLNEVL